MDFELTKEHKLIKSQVREFMKKQIAPQAEEIDRENRFPKGLWKQLGDLGILGVCVPEAYGGSGYDILAGVLATAEIARVCPAISLSYGAHSNLCADNLARNGNERQKQKYLPGLCSGDIIGCMGLTEPGAGSDAVGITTTADKDGGHYVLNGSKIFITNGPIADLALVHTKTEPDKKARGMTAFLVEKGTPGFSAGPPMEKIGNRGSPTGLLFFTECRVAAEDVLGGGRGGGKVMMAGLDVERVVVSAMSLGIGEAALELSLKYARQRKQFGRPICDFQLIKAKLADMYTQLTAAKGMIYRAAALADTIQTGGKGTPVHKLAAATVLFTAEATSRAVNEALQIHGGYGYTMEYPINRFYRDAKLYEIGAGTSEIRRLLIANELIKKGTGYI